MQNPLREYSVRDFDVKDFGDNGLRQKSSFRWGCERNEPFTESRLPNRGPLRSLFFSRALCVCRERRTWALKHPRAWTTAGVQLTWQPLFFQHLAQFTAMRSVRTIYTALMVLLAKATDRELARMVS